MILGVHFLSPFAILTTVGTCYLVILLLQHGVHAVTSVPQNNGCQDEAIPGTIWVIGLQDQCILSGARITGDEARQASIAYTSLIPNSSDCQSVALIYLKNLVLP